MFEYHQLDSQAVSGSNALRSTDLQQHMPRVDQNTTNERSKETLLLIAIFALAIALRLALAIVNRQANDDHLKVVSILLQGFHRLSRADCPECFHPKLYYTLCAALIKILGIHLHTPQIQAAQLLNAVAGIATLAFILAFLRRSAFSAQTRVIAFAMSALNPRLIAINGQASNDTFAILFGTAAAYGFWRFLQWPSRSLFLKTTGAIALAIASKGTTLVLGIALGLAFGAQTIGGVVFGHWRRAALRLAILLGIMVSAIAIGNYDFSSYRDYGQQGRHAPLHFFERTLVSRPGVVSIAESYFTFRLVGMLIEPTITNDEIRYPWHRTSVWSQLYGRLHVAQFDSHPPMWRTRDPHVFNVSRVLLVLGLLPTSCFFWGVGKRARGAWRAWRRRGWSALIDMKSLWPLIVIVGYMMFTIKFTRDFRDFSAMKAIYLFPGMLAFVVVFTEGIEALVASVEGSKLWSRLVQGTFAALALLYAWDVVLVIIHLVAVGRTGRW